MVGGGAAALDDSEEVIGGGFDELSFGDPAEGRASPGSLAALKSVGLAGPGKLIPHDLPGALDETGILGGEIGAADGESEEGPLDGSIPGVAEPFSFAFVSRPKRCCFRVRESSMSKIPHRRPHSIPHFPRPVFNLTRWIFFILTSGNQVRSREVDFIARQASGTTCRTYVMAGHDQVVADFILRIADGCRIGPVHARREGPARGIM